MHFGGLQGLRLESLKVVVCETFAICRASLLPKNLKISRPPSIPDRGSSLVRKRMKCEEITEGPSGGPALLDTR